MADEVRSDDEVIEKTEEIALQSGDPAYCEVIVQRHASPNLLVTGWISFSVDNRFVAVQPCNEFNQRGVSLLFGMEDVLSITPARVKG